MYQNKETNYRALISDFDNTLVGVDKQIPAAVVAKVIELQKAGIIFAIATGRAYTGYIKQACEDLALQHPVITRGGAEIIDPLTHEVMYAKYIDPETARHLVQHLSAAELPFLLESGQTAYYSPTFDTQKVREFAQAFPISACQFTAPVPKIYVSSLHDEETIDAIISELEKEFAHTASLQKIQSGAFFGLDILAGGVSKHSAVLEWMKISALSPAEVVAVGDGYNDFALLAACGLKVAVANAHEELKKLADFIAPAQSENGIITVIDTFFLHDALQT